ncbi:MAG: hypothetical protein HKO59_07930 [Phycisphaerales bacterium]|nr:hypothetical protein [Phycisphaerae bacterium]NNF45073.1 hypothetical protein [Phycisphaerales bacterium]NNM25902.1 hypothetical protein [Phycisphaerales bacterium]
MRRLGLATVTPLAAVIAAAALADLTPWKDYEISEAVWEVTTVKVGSNMGDAYLEGIRNTWAAGNDVAISLGHIVDYKIMRSELPESGDFNLLLMIKYRDTEALAPSKKKYDEFMQAWGEERNRETTEFAQRNYPAMRTLTGQYRMREITLK